MQPDIIAGRYRIVRPVGRGGMGTVWLCTDETLHRQVAVKQIGSLPGESPHDTARAMREARLAAALNHSNAVSVYDVVEHGGSTWLVMEYMPSRTLSQVIASEGSLSPRRVAHIGAQVASALSSAHSLGIIHRDIKPGNILVAEDELAKISDFGIARGQLDMRLTQTGMVTGTPAYFSPELARGEDATYASDVWALGVTLYTATEGAPPHQRQTNPLAMLSVIANEPPPRPTHAGPLAPVLARMLDPDVSRRTTMAEALASLRDVERQTSAVGSGGEVPATSVAQPLQAATLESPVEPDFEQPVALPVASGRWVDQPSVAVDSPDRDRGWLGRLALAVLGLLVLVGAGALLVNMLGHPTGSHSGASSLGQSANSKVRSSSGVGSRRGTSPPSRGSGSSSAVATTSAPTTSTTPRTTGPPPESSSPVTSSTQPGAGSAVMTPQDFTRLYYSTVPGDLDAGWSMIAPSMRSSVGRASYNGFWGSIKSVAVSDVVALDAHTVRYRITYTTYSGSTSVETKELTLTGHGGSYLITSDASVS